MLPTGLSIEQTILKDLKELSDGEIKVAVSTVTMTLEVRAGDFSSQKRFRTIANTQSTVSCCVSLFSPVSQGRVYSEGLTGWEVIVAVEALCTPVKTLHAC